jgi:Mycothiol maleylpyruvate isomerase N-terminal domain
VRLSRAERERVFVAVADERRSIATLIDGLNCDQLATESLCAGWDVKTVAAHLVSDFADGFMGFMASGIRHGSIDRGIDAHWLVAGREPQPQRSPRRYVVELIIGSVRR